VAIDSVVQSVRAKIEAEDHSKRNYSGQEQVFLEKGEAEFKALRRKASTIRPSASRRDYELLFLEVYRNEA
jgi:hypothetical protein